MARRGLQWALEHEALEASCVVLSAFSESIDRCHLEEALNIGGREAERTWGHGVSWAKAGT